MMSMATTHFVAIYNLQIQANLLNGFCKNEKPILYLQYRSTILPSKIICKAFFRLFTLLERISRDGKEAFSMK